MDWFVWVLTIAIALVTFTIPYVSGHTQFTGWKHWAWFAVEIAWFYVVIAALRGEL